MAGALVRWLIFAGILLAVGAVTFRLALLPAASRANDLEGWPAFRQRAEDTAATLGLAAAASLFVPVLLRLVRQIVRFQDPSVAVLPQIAGIVGRTTWGRGWAIQALAVALLALVFSFARRTGRSAAWWAAALVVVPLAASPALASHAGRSGRLSLVTLVADAGHLLAAGAWLGTLLVMLIVVAGIGREQSRWARQRTTTALVRAFTPVALLSAGTVVLTGVLLGVWHIQSVDALFSSRYGTLFGLKLLGAILLLGLGAYDWKALKPTLEEAEGSPTTLLRNGATEFLITAVILLVTAFLVATPHPAGP